MNLVGLILQLKIKQLRKKNINTEVENSGVFSKISSETNHRMGTYNNIYVA